MSRLHAVASQHQCLDLVVPLQAVVAKREGVVSSHSCALPCNKKPAIGKIFFHCSVILRRGIH